MANAVSGYLEIHPDALEEKARLFGTAPAAERPG
jgi:hypothetical protein